jgi:hypothetical protein
VDEQRFERGADVAPTSDAHPLQRGGRSDDPPRVHLETGAPQDVGEEQQIRDERAFGHGRLGVVSLARVSARPSNICRRSPLTA